MKKLFVVLTLLAIGCVKLFAFGVGGGYSVDSGIGVTLHFLDSEKTAIGVGIAVDPGVKGGFGGSLFFDGYYDFLLVDNGAFNFGPELAVDVGTCIVMMDDAFMFLGYCSPAAGVKFGICNGNLDIYARYQPYFIVGGGGAVQSDDQTAVITDIKGFNFIGFALGVRYHFR